LRLRLRLRRGNARRIRRTTDESEDQDAQSRHPTIMREDRAVHHG
jgi:hypothetical protein